MANLYDLTANWQQVYNMEEIDEEAWFDTLSSIDEAIEDKGNNIAKLIRSLETDVEAYKAEATGGAGFLELLRSVNDLD